MQDPLTSLNIAPPRYTFDSDSEDEDDAVQGSKASSSRSIPVELKFMEKRPFKEVVIGVGQAGRYLQRHVRGGDVILEISAGSDLARGVLVGETLIIIVEEAEGVMAHTLAKRLIGDIHCERW